MRKAAARVLALALLLPPLWGRPTVSGQTTPSRTPEVYRIVDGAATGRLLLADKDRGVYSLNVTGMALAEPLSDGMLVQVDHAAGILETYPMQFHKAWDVYPVPNTAPDDRCGLYLRVLDDLWAADPGLNGDVADLGVDLSGVTDLTEAEKAAVAYAFGMAHGPIFPLRGTFDELSDQGYIDRARLVWEDGLLFTLSGSAGGGFDAQKWRSGDGAISFYRCTAVPSADGTWTYEPGSCAIS